jgi:hypothetical protein
MKFYLRNAVGERRTLNAARRKYVPQTLDSASCEDAAEDALNCGSPTAVAVAAYAYSEPSAAVVPGKASQTVARARHEDS